MRRGYPGIKLSEQDKLKKLAHSMIVHLMRLIDERNLFNSMSSTFKNMFNLKI